MREFSEQELVRRNKLEEIKKVSDMRGQIRL